MYQIGSMCKKSLMLLTLLGSSSLLYSQMELQSDQRRNGKMVREAFSEQRAVLQTASAVLYDGWRSFNYAIVVSENGYLLAKASELDGREDFYVRVGEEKYTDVSIVAQSPRWDLALLEITAENLTPVKWAESSDVSQGSWVIANGVTERDFRRINVGIVSAKSREIEGGAAAVLGVSFHPKKDSLVVEFVTPETGAEEAGLKNGDKILTFGGAEVATRDGLIEKMRDCIPGESVPIEFEREGKKLEVEVELMSRNKAYKENKSRNDAMSGDYSLRRSSFPRVLQTDIPFSARTIGGPLLNLDGECIGMNIARANRAESFAIPVEELREELQKMLDEVGE